MKRIINDWGTKSDDPDDYIFPALTKGMSALVQYQQLGLFVRSVNDWMAKIKIKLGIKRTVTTYVARHTFSTVLKKAGVSTGYIREALGHTSAVLIIKWRTFYFITRITKCTLHELNTAFFTNSCNCYIKFV